MCRKIKVAIYFVEEGIISRFNKLSYEELSLSCGLLAKNSFGFFHRFDESQNLIKLPERFGKKLKAFSSCVSYYNLSTKNLRTNSKIYGVVNGFFFSF